MAGNRRRVLLLSLLGAGMVGCAKHRAPGSTQPSAPVSALSLSDRYDQAGRQIAADVAELNRHRVYTMNIPFRGYYTLKRLVLSPSPQDRDVAARLLEDIVEQAIVQLNCADAMKSEGRRALTEDLLRRVQRTRETLDLVGP